MCKSVQTSVFIASAYKQKKAAEFTTWLGKFIQAEKNMEGSLQYLVYRI